jgi:hypothetical protein
MGYALGIGVAGEIGRFPTQLDTVGVLLIRVTKQIIFEKNGKC